MQRMSLSDGPINQIHIWDFPVGTTVELNPLFLLHLNALRKAQFKSLQQFWGACAKPIPFLGFKNSLKSSFPNFRDLHVFLLICRVLGVPKESFEQNVSAYRFKRSRIVITKQYLPVFVSPVFPMLIAHMIADGNMVRFKNKQSIYFSYRQYNQTLRLLLLSKFESLFWKLNYKTDYFRNGTRVYLPEVLTKILCDYYRFSPDGFLSKTALLPKKLFEEPPSHLLAVLVAFLIDEGSIDSAQPVIGLKNEALV